MVWFIDEYLDSVLRGMKLCPGVDVSIETREIDGLDICIYISWHSPGINVGWYPICQIDYNDRTIFHREGPENPDGWERFVEKAADALAAALTKGGN